MRKIVDISELVGNLQPYKKERVKSATMNIIFISSNAYILIKATLLSAPLSSE